MQSPLPFAMEVKSPLTVYDFFETSLSLAVFFDVFNLSRHCSQIHRTLYIG